MLVPYGQCIEVHTDMTWSQKYKGLDIYAWYQMTSYPMFVCFIIHVHYLQCYFCCQLNCIHVYNSMHTWIFAWKWCVNTICSSVCMLIDLLFTCIINWTIFYGLINKHQCNTNSIFFTVTIYAFFHYKHNMWTYF